MTVTILETIATFGMWANSDTLPHPVNYRHSFLRGQEPFMFIFYNIFRIRQMAVVELQSKEDVSYL